MTAVGLRDRRPSMYEPRAVQRLVNYVSAVARILVHFSTRDPRRMPTLAVVRR